MKKGTLILILVLVGLILVIGGYFLSHRSEHPGEALHEHPGTEAPATPGASIDQPATGEDAPAETPADETPADE